MNGWGDPLRSSATARKPAYLAVRAWWSSDFDIPLDWRAQQSNMSQ